MNLVKFNDKQIKLTSKQEKLYSAIVEKINNYEPLTFDDAKKLYIENGCQNVKDGIPYRYTYTYNEDDQIFYRANLVPMEDYFLRQSVLNYILRGIGILVMKGALKVIPQLELN